MILKIQPGVIVTYKEQQYKVKSPLSLERVLIDPLAPGEPVSALLSELQPASSGDIESDNEKHNTRAIIEFTEKDWTEAKRREKLIQVGTKQWHHFRIITITYLFLLNLSQLEKAHLTALSTL